MTFGTNDGKFLHHTLNQKGNFAPSTWELENGISVNHSGHGVLEFSPPSPVASVVISSGIHGDETAPIELVDSLAESILSGSLVPGVRLLLVIGHTSAIHAHCRFIEENLNRLFSSINEETNQERALANRLQTSVSDFFSRGDADKPKWHLDLHSAIRDSKHYMFGVVPASTSPKDIRPLANLLQGTGIDALLLSRTPSPTFSWFSSEKHNAIVATLEMGRVAPLFQNNMEEFAQLKIALEALISGGRSDNEDIAVISDMAVYKVTRTITKTDDNFRLTFSNDTANFTHFDGGVLLAHENERSYFSLPEGEAVVFPNAKVATGQRACLLVQPFVPDWTKPLFAGLDKDPYQE